MIVTARTVQHWRQRYKTVGDWQTPAPGHVTIAVSVMKDWRYEALVMLHEAVEAAICIHRGITQAEVDEWDKAWDGEGEPGDDPAAPYHDAHMTATRLERQFADALGVEWETYEKELDSL
jgi:hypothetical protein